MRWSRPILVLTLGLVLIGPVPAHSETFLPASHPKVRAAQNIYDSLVRTIGDARVPPDLRMVAGKASNFDVAVYLPGRRAIYIEEQFYDLLQANFPASNHSQALALILGHELAHFFRNHAWMEDFNRSFTQRQVVAPANGKAGPEISSNESATELRRLETEADYFAGFYAHLAGFPTGAIASQVFDSVYAHYHFDPALPGYEHLRQRKETMREAQHKLRSLIPLFEAGIQSLLIRDYRNAERIFSRVATEFPSPEVLSNAAVADILAALEWYGGDEQRYIYPIEIDPDSRLSAEATRGPVDLTPAERAERRRTLLQRAKQSLEKVMRLHPSYVPASLNLACVLDLLGEYEPAMGTVASAMSLSRAQDLTASMAHARTIAGIVLAHQGHQEQSTEEFNRAAEMGDRTAAINLKAAKVTDGDTKAMDPSGPYLPEQVGGMKIVDITEKDFLRAASLRTLGRWDEVDDESPALIVQTMDRGVVRATALIRGTGLTRSVVYIASADPEALGETVRSIRRGQTDKEVEHAYGAPGSTLNLAGGRYAGYHIADREEGGIVFRYDAAQVIQEWVVYRIERP